jgi:hypothetical protein
MPVPGPLLCLKRSPITGRKSYLPFFPEFGLSGGTFPEATADYLVGSQRGRNEMRKLRRGREDYAAAATFALALASRGSETQTTVPTPSVERSFIEPPCRLASDFAIARPRPEP